MNGTQYAKSYVVFRKRMAKYDFSEHWGTDKVKCDHCNKVTDDYKIAKDHFQARHKNKKCNSCHKEKPLIKKYDGEYCKECIKLDIRCSGCGRLFMSHWALTGHPSHGQDIISVI